MEVMELHAKLDHPRDQQWGELVALQARQIDLLEKILGTVATRSV
jgi:hypothetical protein